MLVDAGRRGPATMRNEALHAAVLAAPDDDTPRLVYADWLLARGDPRGELIALQVELGRTPDGERRQELLDREQALWAAHGDVWRPKDDKLSVRFERGFIEQIRCEDVWRLAMHLEDLLNWACLETLHISDVAEFDLALVVDQFHRMVLRELYLELTYHQFTAEQLAALRSSPHLARIEKLGLARALNAGSLPELARWPHPRTLKSLNISRNKFWRTELRQFVHAEAFAAIEHLDLTETDIGPADIEAIIAAKLPLVTLELNNTRLNPAAASAIANAPHLAGLRRLALSDAGIGLQGIAALVASPYLDRELQLVLDGDLFGLPGPTLTDRWDGEPPPELAARFRVEFALFHRFFSYWP